MKDKILFIDRDGTLIDEPISDFKVDRIQKLLFKKNVISSLSELIKFGYKLVMVTNQDGLGTKQFSWMDFNIPHNFMLSIFHSEGIVFDDILICPHFLQDNCSCRKPKISMLTPWLDESSIDREHSYVIGDRDTDMELAKNLQLIGFKYEDKKFNWIKIKKEIIKRNRYAEIIRKTKETKIHIKLWLDLQESSDINTGINFFDHMLQQLSVHSGICFHISAIGDLHIDDHHTIEDTGIVLGEALLQSMGNKRGLRRFGFHLPMDESKASCLIDISGRPYLKFQAHFKNQKIGDLSTEMIQHFFYSLCYSMKITLHLCADGKNDHHCIESLFKVFGRALGQSIKLEGGDMLPTSKGML